MFRLIREEDYEMYYRLLLDEPVVQWIFHEDMKDKMRKDMLDVMMSFYWNLFIEGKERETYTVFLGDSNEFLGEVSLYRNDKFRSEIGISILKVYRGKGFGKGIIKEWSMWIACNRELQQLDIHIEEDNLASRKCFEGLGADYIGNEDGLYYILNIPIS